MATATFPAEFTLVCSMNPCPCGNLGHPKKACTCPPSAVRRYMGRVSGPLMERIDIQVPVAPPSFGELSEGRPAGGNAAAAERVLRARRLQGERWSTCGGSTNARVPAALLTEAVRLRGRARDILRRAVSRLSLSARSYHKIIRMARTIADLDGVVEVGPEHVSEAVQYRNLEREAARFGLR